MGTWEWKFHKIRTTIIISSTWYQKLGTTFYVDHALLIVVKQYLNQNAAARKTDKHVMGKDHTINFHPGGSFFILQNLKIPTCKLYHVLHLHEFLWNLQFEHHRSSGAVPRLYS